MVTGSSVTRWLAAWLGAVATVAGVSWLAIDAAGQQVGGVSGDSGVSGVSGSLRGGEPGGTFGSGVGTGGATAPAAGPGNLPLPGARPTTTSSSPKATATTATAVSATKVTVGGTVSLTCAAAGVSGWSAQPAYGWTVKLRRSTARTVEVGFASQGGDGSQVRVSGLCSGGQPSFRVGRDGSQSDDGDDDGDGDDGDDGGDD